MGTPQKNFSAMYLQREHFCDFLIASMDNKVLPKWGLFLKKQISSTRDANMKTALAELTLASWLLTARCLWMKTKLNSYDDETRLKAYEIPTCPDEMTYT